MARGQLQRVQRRARVAFAARGQEVECLVVDRHRVVLDRDRVGGRPAQHRAHLLRRERLQRVHAHAREQRAVDLERGVLGRGADQRHQALLDSRQQRVLLGLVEAVDLVEEQDRLGPARPAAPVAAVGGALDHRAHLRAPGGDGAQLLERRLRALGDDSRERRLARSRRAVQHHRVWMPLLDRRPQRRVRAEQVGLADELVEAARTDSNGQRVLLPGGLAPSSTALLAAPPPSRSVRLDVGILVKQGIHAPEYRWCGERPFCGSGRLTARVVEGVDSVSRTPSPNIPRRRQRRDECRRR